MTRMAFYLSRPYYHEFKKETIDGHIFQEESTAKFLKQYRARYGEGDDYNSDDGDGDEDDPEDNGATDEEEDEEEEEG